MLEINASLLFIALLVWILMHILKRLLFEPVSSIIDQRYKLTTGAKIEAEKINQQAQQLLDEYQQKIKRTKTQINENIKKQISSLQQQKYINIKKTKNELDEMIEKTASELQEFINNITPKLKKESATIAALISKQILNREILHYDIEN